MLVLGSRLPWDAPLGITLAGPRIVSNVILGVASDLMIFSPSGGGQDII